MASSDRIQLRDLRLRTIVGVHEHERHAPRDVVLQLELWVDLQAAGSSDSLDDTVDYEQLGRRVAHRVESSTRRTIEALAHDIIDVCLEHPLVQGARVVLDKPEAVISSASVAVIVERMRPDTSAS